MMIMVSGACSRWVLGWLLVLSVSMSALSLSVVADDWRPRERGARGARDRSNNKGVMLYGKKKKFH